ncbi:class A beta-lactamase [Streptomyces sp. NBC_00452]|uniref:class A beta-lactamase n=1 Tax=Streptomyces sp. NBC_00452 TaxID=2975746 RepID=UPI0022598006|nr:class A beta-lactamase [Streptomyces sp. NBC_00452]MCX5057237.1 class A beta-lactamase [Streptomyces sp. NBC_00452]
MAGRHRPKESKILGRRTLLTAGTATAAALLTSAPAHATTDHPREPKRLDQPAQLEQLARLERRHGARLGVFAHNVRTKRTVAYRADERFPICSVFKTLVAGAVLRDLDRHGEVLARRIHYRREDLVDGAPVTGTEEHLANGMTVAELCDAAIRYSDNSAANFLLRLLGGPTAITRFARSLGDGVTRLDRWEPELNSAEPGRVTDTTSPRAIAGTYGRLVVGDALNRQDRDRLTHWLLNNTTGDHRIRAGVPASWTVGDKTGSGSYGTTNDAGVAWTPDGAPVVLAFLSTKPAPDAAWDDALIAGATAAVVDALA